MILSPISRLAFRVLVDFVCIVSAFVFATWITLQPGQAWLPWVLSHDSYAFVYLGLWFITALDQRMYSSRRGESLPAILFSLTRVYFIVIILSGFILALYTRSWYDRDFFLIFILSNFAIFLTAVVVARPWVFKIRRRYSACRVLFVGADHHATRLAKAFQEDIQNNYHIVGFLDSNKDRFNAMEEFDIPYLGQVEDITKYLVESMVDEVYIALPLGQHYEEVGKIAKMCEMIGVTVRLAGDILPIPIESSDVSSIRDIPLISLMTRPRYLSEIHLQRLIEVGATSLLLVALTPLLALIALLTKVDSKGPVVVSKKHTNGKKRQNVTLAFRTTQAMDAGDALTAETVPTRIAGLLTSFGLEDLPQLFNVLLGKSSYMGIPIAAKEIAKPSDGKSASPSASIQKQILPTVLLAAIDACCILISYIAAIRVTSMNPELATLSMVNYLPFFAVLLLAWYAAAVERRLWRWRTVEPLSSEMFGLLRAMGNATIVCGFLLAVFIPGVQSMRNFLVIFCATSFVSVLLFRIAARFVSQLVYAVGYRIRQVIVIGANERSERLLEAIGPETRFGYKVAGILEGCSERIQSMENLQVPHLGTVAELEELLPKHSVHEVYVTLPVRSQFDTIKEIVQVCERTGVSLHIEGNLLPLDIAKSRTVLIGNIPLISLASRSERYSWLAVKRVLDFLASTALIIAFAPLFVVLSILIKMESGGPIFFVQDRIGQGHRFFKMIKFRSMVADAEDRKADLMHLNEADGPTFKIKEDPRVTKFGQFLRRYSLDELPQLFNVWMGQMSLVGPRPLMPHEVDKFKWFERRRLSVKPGMTGLWQVSGRNDINFDEWIAMDLTYIDTWSFWQDIVILTKTFNAVISTRGAS